MTLPRRLLSSPRAQGALAALVLHGVAWALVWPALNARPAAAQPDRGPALIYLSSPAQPLAPVSPLAAASRAPAPQRSMPAHPRALFTPGVATAPSPEPPVLVALASTPVASMPMAARASVAAAASVAAPASTPAPVVHVTARPLAGNALPEYPEAAREDGLQGRVRLLLTIDTQGRVEAVQWLQRSGIALLDLAARDAARTWRYEPARLGTEAVASTITVAIRFQLDQPVSGTWLASQ